MPHTCPGQQVWKEKVLPHLAAHLSSSVDSVTVYQLLYHEAVVANLLEVCLYHRRACEALPDDALLELCDWCYRKLVLLNTTDFGSQSFTPGEPTKQQYRYKGFIASAERTMNAPARERTAATGGGGLAGAGREGKGD